MHPFSPHAPSSSTRHKTPMLPAPVRSTRMVAAGTPMSGRTRMRVVPDPLDMLAAEVTAKAARSESAYRAAHVAAEELKIRRPRRPSARRAAFRTPPASR